MLSFNYHSTPTTMEAASRHMSGPSRKSSRIFEELDDKFVKLKVDFQSSRRRTATPRELLETMLLAENSSTIAHSFNEDSRFACSSYQQHQHHHHSRTSPSFLDAFDQAELENLMRKKSSLVSFLPSVPEGAQATTTVTLGVSEMNTDLNTTLQDISEGKEEEETSSDSDELTGCKKFTRTVLPHVGLILLTCTYTLIGASIFYSVEQPHEVREKTQTLVSIHREKNELLRDIWRLAQKRDIAEEDFNRYGHERMGNITDLLYTSFAELHMTAAEFKDNQTHVIWTFSAAVFFAVTVVTTVGYGNPVPVTLLGRVVCILFSLVGVPLTLLTIADVGKFFSEHLIWLYGCYLELKLRIEKKMRRMRRRPSFEKLCDHCRDKQHNHVHSTAEHHSHIQNTLSSEFDNFDIQEKTVPATLLLFILVCYTALGGLLMCHLETWTFFESFYFSFITMTTIGFGDLVPTKGGHIFIILLYIVLGLVITTMCIDLVGVHYIQKIHYFGRKIQDARSALAIVGGKVVYISDLYAHLLSKRYGIPKDRIGMMTDAFIIDSLYSTKHLIPFVPRDIRRIRYIDECSDSLTTSSTSYDNFSCKYCHSRMAMSPSQ